MPVAQILPKDSPVFQSHDKCPFCTNVLTPGDVVIFCPIDNTAYHDSCWAANDNKCSILGCPGSGEIEYADRLEEVVLNKQTVRVGTFSEVVTEVAAASVDPLRQAGKQVLQPKTAMLISWLATCVLAYMFASGRWSPLFNSSLRFDRAVALSTALFAIIASTAYQYYQQRKLRGWRGEVTRWLGAIVLGFASLTLSDRLVWNLPLLNEKSFVEPQLLYLGIISLVTGTMTHAASWNSLQYFRKPTYVLIRLSTAVAVTAMGAIVALDLLDLGPYVDFLGTPVGLYLTVLVGLVVGATICSQVGLWSNQGQPTIAPRWWLETAMTTALLAGVGILIGQLVWIYSLEDVLFEFAPFQSGAGRDELHLLLLIGLGVLGAAYGTSKQAQSGLMAIIRLIAKLIFIAVAIGLVVGGGYIGFSIARDLGLEDVRLQIVIGAVSSLITLLILRSLYRYFKELASS